MVEFLIFHLVCSTYKSIFDSNRFRGRKREIFGKKNEDILVKGKERKEGDFGWKMERKIEQSGELCMSFNSSHVTNLHKRLQNL